MNNLKLYTNLPEKIIQLLNFFDASSDVVMICDCNLCINYVNPSFTKLTGYKTKEVLGKNYKDFNTDAAAKILDEKNWAKFLKEKTITISCVSNKKNGEEYFLEKSIIPVHAKNDGMITHLIFSGKDSSEHIYAINRILQSKTALAEAQKIAKLGFYVTNLTKDSWTSSTELNNIFGIKDNLHKNFNSWLNLIHPDYKELMLNYFTNQILTKKEKFDKEYKIINQKTGEEKWVHGLGHLTFNEQNQPIEMFGTIQDITERKLTEENLHKKDERLHDLIFSLGDWVWEIDNEGVFTYSSKQVHQLLGVTVEEVIGKTPFSLMAKEDAKKMKDVFTKTVENKLPIKDVISWHIHKNGRKVCLLTNGVPILDEKGNLKGYRGVDKDITESVIAQDTLIANEKKYRDLIESMNDGVIKTDNNDIIQFVNNKFCTQLGYKKNELIGKKASNIILYSKNEKKIINEKIENRKNKLADIYELACKNKNGEKKWFLVSGSPTYNLEGKINGSLGIHTDITERRKIEQDLKASEKKFRELFEKSSDAILIIQNGIFVDCNDATSKMLGYKSKTEFLNTHPSNLSPEFQPDGINSFDKAKNMMDLAFKKGSHRFEWMHTKKDNIDFPVEVLLTPISSESGNKILHCVWRDISDRKKTEQALIESEDKFRSIFHSLSAGMVIVIDEDGKVVEWNEGSQLNFGYTSEEMVNKPLTVFMPERYRDSHEKGLARAIRNRELVTKGITHELFGLRKNGDEFPMELTLGTWERNGKLFFSAIMIDITERKESEKSILRANSILDDIDSIILLTNIKGEVIYTTSTIKNLTGYEPEEILDNKWWEISFTNKKESTRIKNELISYLKNNKLVRTTNHPRLIKCKDGSLKWFEWHNSRGVDNCIISVGYDITEKNYVEQQLQNTLNNLEQLVKIRTEELEKTLKKLEVSLNKEKELGDLKSKFVSTASHQFRTPLTVIQANIGLITMQADAYDNELKSNLKRVTNRIQSEVERMTELMNDVLILGKINAGRIIPDYKLTDVLLIAKDVCSKHNDIQPDGREIIYKIIGEPYRIMVDEKLLEHTISNLISNAFKYSTGQPPPVLTIMFYSKEVKISVTDYGLGIPPDDIKHLFQTFYRASNVNELSGTGLGIAIAKEYTELNGGKISVTSKLNEGSEFMVTLKT